ncbi:kinase-like protein [Sistotremastrum suecicum HHB10207 ss-3]|uniref:Kinase-like protein n=1 Tax=Sistotremastrum suecicum HHB10207 ss-3 TaxID=1314776 RepID=A0A166BQ52_9AGAM|nr:kinase-like protein [Sistotremastrum suecicum HHB10207 ss-3]
MSVTEARFDVTLIAVRQNEAWKGKFYCTVSVGWEDTARGVGDIDTESGDILDDGSGSQAIPVNKTLKFAIRLNRWHRGISDPGNKRLLPVTNDERLDRQLDLKVMQTIEYDDDEGTKETIHYVGKAPMHQVFDSGIVEDWFPLTNDFYPERHGIEICVRAVFSPIQPERVPEPQLSNTLSSYSGRRNPEQLQDLTGQVVKVGSTAFAWGGFSDVWVGEWTDSQGTRKVAIKILHSSLNLPKGEEDKLRRRLRREIKVWQSLDHPNVVKLLGICTDLGPFPSMVSAWHERGNAAKYLESLGNRATLRVKVKLLTEVARGIEYLHSVSPQIVHGDLKGANILVNDAEEACLTDFGLSKIDEVASSSTFSTSSFSATVRWMAREMAEAVSDDVFFLPTVWTDIWAYGCVILEIITGQVPYYDKKNEPSVLVSIASGKSPKIPDNVSIRLELQDVMERCWLKEPSERPSISEIAQQMSRLWAESEDW